ncbi:MAG: NAD(P)/FAD-dependent oxidoreductase [Mycetocola sp.]
MATNLPSSPTVDGAFIRTAVDEANVNALRLALYQVTGDAELGQMRAAKGNVGGREFMDFRLTAADAAVVRQKAVAYLSNPPATLPPPPPSKEDSRRLIDLFGQETTDDEFEFGYEELAFEEFPRDAKWTHRPSEDRLSRFKVVIIGGGISGIAAAIQFKRLGINFTVVERQADLGGTWMLNRYPEVRVDTSSYLYQYKFEKNYPWSEYFATGEETFRYLSYIAHKYGIIENFRFNREATAAVWDQASARWAVTVSTTDGNTETYEANLVVSASGLFSSPKLPDISGIDDFQGASFHTAHWDHSVDYRNKRMAVIGTGSTGTQLIPRMAREAAHLSIFQRTANWVMEQRGYRDPVSETARWLFDNMPYYYNWYCYAAYFTGQQFQHMQRVDPDWQAKGGKISENNDKLNELLTNEVRVMFADRPDLLEKVLPKHVAFTRRMIVTNGFYETLKRDNVELITDDIERITSKGVRTIDGVEREFDVIVFGSGFAVQQYFWPTRYIGRDGMTLERSWEKDGPRAYLGLAMPGFPNLLVFYGPNGQPRAGGFYSWAEIWARYIGEVAVQMIEQDFDTIEVKKEVFDSYNAKLDERLKGMLWTREGHSYYVNQNGRVTVNTPWTTEEYHGMVRTPNFDDYELGRVRTRPAALDAIRS